MDTLLVFAGLFSAVVTAFIVQVQQLLNETPQDRTNDLILVLIKQVNASDYKPDISDNFKLSGNAIAANVLFFCSLVVTLFSALSAILVKQWILSYDQRTKSGSTSQSRARARYRAWAALENAHMLKIISAIPMLLHAGLFLFFGGLMVWLFKFLGPIVYGTTLFFTSITVVLYVIFGVIGILVDDSPFQWPFVDLLRIIFGRKRSPPSECFSPWAAPVSSKVGQLVLVGEELSSMNSVDLLAFHTDDIAIVCKAIESSTSSTDVSRAIMQLRNLMLLPGFDPKTGFGAQFDPEYRLMAIQKCAYLVAPSIVESNSLPWLKPDAIQQARAVCYFLEAYLQFSFSGPNHYNVLRTSKFENLAEAFLDFSLTNPDGKAVDVVATTALLGKLSHNVLGYEKKCRRCFRFDSLPNTFLFGLNGIIPKEREDGVQLSSGILFGGEKIVTVHHYLRIFIMTLTDCLLHHYRPRSSLDWRLVVDNFQEPINAALTQIMTDSTELAMLRSYLDRQRLDVLPGSQEANWITAVYPPSYSEMVANPESPSISSRDLSITGNEREARANQNATYVADSGIPEDGQRNFKVDLV
ncbi:hypothetical protein FRC19_005335 [Serendipita sp. 401]|nr:hypothetical protein FRC19_005335 [Serendipita sp. 401]KAG9054625.1 hypothetical protein FS842_004644 [Serendipita sp. 407]